MQSQYNHRQHHSYQPPHQTTRSQDLSTQDRHYQTTSTVTSQDQSHPPTHQRQHSVHLPPQQNISNAPTQNHSSNVDDIEFKYFRKSTGKVTVQIIVDKKFVFWKKTTAKDVGKKSYFKCSKVS